MKLLWTTLLLSASLFAQSSTTNTIQQQIDINALDKACDAGKMSACNALGVSYATGRGVERDQIKATKLYAKACVGNDMNGCYNLGVARTTGRGVRKNSKKAEALFQKACDNGHQKACDKLK